MRRLIVVAGLIVLGLVAAPPAQATEISFSSASVEVGQEFQVNIMLSPTDLTVFSFAFEFFFNSAIVQFNDVSGEFSEFDMVLGPMGDSFVFGFDMFGVDVSTGTLLATLTFTAIAAGNPALLLANAAILGTPGGLSDVDVVNGNVVVNPVPEPSTLGLMGIGLAAVARRLRRRNAPAMAKT
jgi:hypothetical protein